MIPIAQNIPTQKFILSCQMIFLKGHRILIRNPKMALSQERLGRFQKYLRYETWVPPITNAALLVPKATTYIERPPLNLLYNACFKKSCFFMKRLQKVNLQDKLLDL